MENNAVCLTGKVVETEPLRYTPAGLPLLQFRLAHKSLQLEAGYKRQVECEVTCIALGDAATRLTRVQPGAEVRVEGFLNRKNRMSAQLVLHANSTEILKETNNGDDEQSGSGTGQGEA